MSVPRTSLTGLVQRLHRDERGVISLLTVFVALMFALIAAMLLNVARHVDDRMRLQNAADAATFSGATTMARGMNSLAFSNHLLCEVFALTAYMREAEAGVSARLTEDVLAEWEEMGGIMAETAAATGVPKFEALGNAIVAKIPYERDIVEAFAAISRSQAEMTRGSLEAILTGPDGSGVDAGYIPRFQRSIVRTTPAMAQLVTNEIATRYSGDWIDEHQTTLAAGLLWRAHTDVPLLVDANDEEPFATRTLPAVDPSIWGPDQPDVPGDDWYLRTARSQRESLARGYLGAWIGYFQGPYFSFAGNATDAEWREFRVSHRPGRETAKMSNLINFWRSTTAGHLDTLLNDEYRYSNLPHVYRRNLENLSTAALTERDHTFVGVAYWKHIAETSPGVYRNPLDEDGVDALAFAQARVFLPRSRFQYCGTDGNRNAGCGWGWWDEDGDWHPYGDAWPQSWDLLSQNWMVQLVPAMAPVIPSILSTQPAPLPDFRPPRLGGATIDDVNRINFH